MSSFRAPPPVLALLFTSFLTVDAVALSTVRVQMFFGGVTLAFGLLHLILYAALPRLRSNLFYAVFLLLYASAFMLDFQEELVSGAAARAALRGHRLLIGLGLLAGLRFFYELMRPQPPRWFGALAAVVLAGSLYAALDPHAHFWVVQVLVPVLLAETVRVVVLGVRSGRQDAWIIAVGFAVFAVFASYDVLLDLALIAPLGEVTNAYQFGTLGLLVATSTYLARDVARTQRRLVEQERTARQRELEHRLLEADAARKTQELEAARTLQRAMLPDALPTLPHLRLAVHLQTATEVGGDYYDAHRDGDVLTLAVGDATGHGNRAGVMVAIAKSLFKSTGTTGDLRAFFHRATRILKQMHLGNLFMALTLLRVRGATLTVTAAGMPPLLLYRAATGTVETITLKGMPLGAFHDFPYQQAERTLAPGDTLLVLTDGLLERFDADREAFGLDRTRAAFAAVADQPPEAVLAHLRAAGDAWAGPHPADDDVTLLVLQCVAEPPTESD